MVESGIRSARGRDIFGNVNHDWTRPSSFRQVESFVNDCRKIADVAHEVVVLDARTRDSHCVHFLKRVGPNQRQRHLARDHDNGRRIHVGIRDAGDRVGSTGTRGDKGHAHLSGSTGVAFGHVHGTLLMSHKVVSYAISRTPQLIINVQHRATWIAEDRIDTFVHECFDQDLGSAWKVVRVTNWQRGYWV